MIAKPGTWSVWVAFRLATLLMVALSVAGNSLPSWVQLLMLGVLVAFLGIPHGAFDPFIAKSRGLWRTGVGLAGFIAVYIALAAIVIALWVLFPVASLFLFLIISAWHFGADWSRHIVIRCAVGLIILGLPAVAYGPDVASIFQMLSGESAATIQRYLAVLGVGAFLVLVVISVLTASGRQFLRSRFLDLFVLALAGTCLPPLVYFVVYFCALHSPMHVGHSLGEISVVDRRPSVGWAVGLTIATLMLGVIGYAVLMPFVSAHAGLLQVVFIGLAALTVPHLALIDGATSNHGVSS